MSINVNRFVNPYSFVPLPRPETSTKGRATGHAGRHDEPVYSGSIGVTWTLRTPLLIPANGRDEGWLTGNRVRVPGSSIAGAVRSLHETMFNGCFRVVDDTYRPGYREAAKTDTSLTLAVVTKAPHGVPTEVRLCTDVVWVDCRDLLARWPRQAALPTTGDVLKFRGAIEDDEGLARAVMVEVDGVEVVRRGTEATAPTDADAQAGARVLMVSSTSARKPRLRNGQPAHAYWAAGKLTRELVPIDPEQDGAMLAAFRAAVADTDDRRRLEGKKDDSWRDHTSHEVVEWWDARGQRRQPVGRRALATGHLFVGDPVWVRRDEKTRRVTTMKLATIWRRPGGDKTVGDRLPDHLKPCIPDHSATNLCLSCATFGAADTSGTTRHEQVSYAGHVRFGAARGTASGNILTIDLAPLGAPRPGSGMFYLRRYEPNPSLRLSERDDHIAAHWGSPDEGGKQDIAGRKFYWHSDPKAQAKVLGETLGRPVPPRYTATRKQTTAKMSRPTELVPAGTVLRSTIVVDQLDAIGVHALLAAIDPARILSAVPGGAARDIATHLGGGKPLGLGSTSVEITSIDLRPLSSRYGAADEPGPDWANAQIPFQLITDRVGRFLGNLTALAHLLDRNALGPDAALVSYPPGSTWDDYQHPDQARATAFAESFKFFGAANGEHLARSLRPWAPLPIPGQNPTLPIVTKERGRR